MNTIHVPTEGYKKPLKIVVARNGETVLCHIHSSQYKEGRTDGVSWSKDLTQTDQECAKNHVKWLGHNPL